MLDQRGFDVAGVQNAPNGPVIGYVACENLIEGRVIDHVIPLGDEDLISDATPVGEVLTVFRRKQRAFVVAGAGVRGIITRADLNKPPVRVYLFGLISLLEMHLRFWARRAYAGETWKKKLSQGRLDAANRLQNERRKRKTEISLLDCLQLCDVSELVVSIADLRNKLELSSKTKAERFLEKAESLRNRLAHSQQDLMEGTSWDELLDIVQTTEALVNKSDEYVEAEVTLGVNDTTALWVLK